VSFGQLGRVGARGLGGDEQPVRLLGHGPRVDALAGKLEPHDGEEDLQAPAPLRRHRPAAPYLGEVGGT
jgi:hypothetical protein